MITAQPNITVIYVSFFICLGLFILIGLLSKIRSQATSKDYLLANHEVKPWLVALSAVATNNSGYMFIGMIGFTYTVGIASIWLAFGWIFGDFLISLVLHRRIREMTEQLGVHSYPSLLANWYPPTFVWLRRIAAVLTIIFLGTYAAAQLNAGSKALYVLFEWHYATGAIIGAIIVFIYCYAGGIRASIWTDAAQSFVMIAAMFAICYLGLKDINLLQETFTQIVDKTPNYFALFPTDLMFGPVLGPVLFVAGWLFAGFSVAGQPHIMVRFMAMDEAKNITRARSYYYSWYSAFFVLTILAGIVARLLIKEVNFDPELALPILALKVLPAPLVGLVLAGIFAAIMSTADSQILSCSASLTEDLFPFLDKYWHNKLATTVVTILAFLIALSASKNVFTLVVFAWAVFGSAFVPLLCLYVFNQKIPQWLGLTMMVTGTLTVIIWNQFQVNNTIFSALPGMLIGFAIFAAAQFKKL